MIQNKHLLNSKAFLAHTMALRALLGMKRPLTFRTRSFSQLSEFAKAALAEEAHAGKSAIIWKRMSIFVVIPVITWGIYNTILMEKEHNSHPREEFMPYEHLRIRKKAFPWKDGNHTLFHNSDTNALPDGYENL